VYLKYFGSKFKLSESQSDDKFYEKLM